MEMFSHFAGAPTVARLFSEPDQKIHGTYDPTLPLIPIFSNIVKTRWGFDRFFNGYVRGPEGTSLAQFQDAVKAGQIPGVPSDAIATMTDYLDALYIMAPGGSSLYDAFVRPIVAVDPGQPPSGGGADPCADVKAQLQVERADAAAASQKLASIKTSIKVASAQARKTLPAGAGGGRYAAALRKLCDYIDEQAVLG